MINYVLATWSGPRRYEIQESLDDRGYFLREHVRALQSFRHSLVTQITVAMPQNDDEPPEYTAAWHSLPSHVGNATVVPFYRPNVGLSYGSWSDAYSRWNKNFRYFIFMEDDYRFCMDDFDRIMIDTMRPRTGYLCGLVRPGQLPVHAGNANGLLRTEALKTVYDKYGVLPHDTRGHHYGDAECAGQVGLSQSVIQAGWELQSVTESYTSHFKHGMCLDPDTGSGPLIMQPLGPYPGKPPEASLGES